MLAEFLAEQGELGTSDARRAGLPVLPAREAIPSAPPTGASAL